MKNIFFSFITVVVIVILNISSVLSKEAEYVRAHFMNMQDAQKRWEITNFDPKLFKASSPQTRAPMAVDALKKQIYVGKNISKLREELGDPDGYFFNDTILAYQIEPYTEAKKEAWQLVFIPDLKNKDKVGSVKIHKKCCYEQSP